MSNTQQLCFDIPQATVCVVLTPHAQTDTASTPTPTGQQTGDFITTQNAYLRAFHGEKNVPLAGPSL